MEATFGADQSKLQVIEDHDSEMKKILEEEMMYFLMKMNWTNILIISIINDFNNVFKNLFANNIKGEKHWLQ